MRFSLSLVAALLLGTSACHAAPKSSETTPAPAAVQVTRPVIVVHAWRDFLTYWSALSSSQKSASPRSADDAQRAYLNGDHQMVRDYFQQRGGGQVLISLGDWLALPVSAFDEVAKALSDPAVQQKLANDANDLAKRMAHVGTPSDTLEFVFMVGDFSSYTTTWEEGNKQVVAVQLESFVPLTRLSSADQSAMELAATWRPDSLATLDEVMPWAAYAAARQFMPELRERITSEGANFAEYVMFHGFSARFAGAIYPESVFGRGIGAVRAEPGQLLDRAWLDIGPTWYPVGTKPYLAARYEQVLTSKLPQGTTLDQAITVLGARAAQQWLAGTRIRREADEAAEVSRLGRVPTLSAWQLLAQQ